MSRLAEYSLEKIGEKKFSLSKVTREIRFVDLTDQQEVYFTDLYHVLDFLSLFLLSRIRILGRRIVDTVLLVDFSLDKDLEPPEWEEFGRALGKLLTIPEKIIKAYLNSSGAYHSALILEEFNPSVAFFLQVVAIESLCNVYYKKPESKDRNRKNKSRQRKKEEDRQSEKLKRFIIEFLPQGRAFLDSDLRYKTQYLGRNLTEDEARVLFAKLLNSIYKRVRSAFVHGGKHVPLCSIVADRLGVAYFVSTKNPGYLWFRRIVREVLVNFLARQQTGQYLDLHSLLMKGYVVHLKAKKAITAGQRVSTEDFFVQ